MLQNSGGFGVAVEGAGSIRADRTMSAADLTLTVALGWGSPGRGSV